ncbi:MAG: UDP-N-acetylmuramoyl-L-alanine--D-glutamate ligase [Bdellovibrionota bacterium]
MNTFYIKNLKTPIAVLGLGKSGSEALSLLQSAGYTPEQIVTYDEKNSSAQFHTPEQMLSLAPKTLVVSPGIPLNSDWIQKLASSGAHITSEITLAASLLTTEKIIGVTGSIGKSTVVSLLGVGVKVLDQNAFIGGNIGTPFCTYALKLIKGEPKAEWIILELSSYQLENCVQLVLDHSIVTFLSANHLERYANIEEYYQTKLKITSITKEFCLFGKTSKDGEKYSAQAKSKTKLVSADNFSKPDFLSNIYLLGKHNKDNFALAAEMAALCHWPEASFMEMAQYRGLPHRLEFVAALGGITYVNDSKATAMDSVLVAVKGCLDTLTSEAKLFLLLGGKDKNLPWSELSAPLAIPQVQVVFFGACGLIAKESTGLLGEYFEKLGSAINYCQKRARVGDVVLLSPGGTSLDEFKNFEERGDFFKTLVLSNFEA